MKWFSLAKIANISVSISVGIFELTEDDVKS